MEKVFVQLLIIFDPWLQKILSLYVILSLNCILMIGYLGTCGIHHLL